jgi:serine/threonine-protein kinase
MSGTILKMLTAQFEAEAKTLQWLGQQSDQIPSLEAFFVKGSDFYIVQEYIQGKDLTSEIGRRPRSEAYTRRFLADILELLAFVHQKKVIHRDLKPHNIMRRSGDDRLILIDFGAVKYATTMVVNDPTNQYSDRAPYTPPFAPMEQLLGKPCFGSDVHAIGITALYALLGQLPELDGQEWDVSGLSVSPGFKAILRKMVRVNYKSRYANAEEVLQALRDLDRPVVAPPPPPPPKPPQLPKSPKPIARRSFLGQAGQLVGWTVAGSIGAVVSSHLLSPPIDSSSNDPPQAPVAPESPLIDAPESVATDNGLAHFRAETVTVDDQGNITASQTIEPEYFTASPKDQPKSAADMTSSTEISKGEPATTTNAPAPQAAEADPFRDALNTATKAAQLTQSAQTPEDWAVIVALWDAAIDQMAAVPTDSPNYPTAQDRLSSYPANRRYAKQKAGQ